LKQPNKRLNYNSDGTRSDKNEETFDKQNRSLHCWARESRGKRLFIPTLRVKRVVGKISGRLLHHSDDTKSLINYICGILPGSRIRYHVGVVDIAREKL
jgi:hypothetical protein